MGERSSGLGSSFSRAEVQELHSTDIKIRATRSGGAGNVEFTLPCGERRRMTGTEASVFSMRIQSAAVWIAGMPDNKEF